MGLDIVAPVIDVAGHYSVRSTDLLSLYESTEKALTARTFPVFLAFLPFGFSVLPANKRRDFNNQFLNPFNSVVIYA
jgi:hypothetical protein